MLVDVTVDEVVELAQALTYRADWSFKVDTIHAYGQLAPVGCVLAVEAWVPDVRGYGQINLVSTINVQDRDRREDVLFRVWEAIRMLEDHERLEWLKVDGQCAFPPHPEGMRGGVSLATVPART